MALLAFAAERRAEAPLLLGSRRSNESIDISCPHGAQQQNCRTLRSNDGTDGRTDGRTLDRFIDPAPHTTPAVSIRPTVNRHTHPFDGSSSGTTRVSWYQRGKTNLDFTEARDSEWQWHQLGSMQVCTLLQTDNHTSAPPLSFLQAGCPSCQPTNSVKALKAKCVTLLHSTNQ